MGSRALIWKLAILAGITVVLLVALARIGYLVDERQQRQREAVENVMQAQAGEQVLLGPLLQSTCTEEWTYTIGEGKDRRAIADKREFVVTATPARLEVDASLNHDLRYRSLFKVNGYAGRVGMVAQWHALPTPRAEHDGGKVRCADPRVMLATSDPRGLRAAEVKRGQEKLAVKPGTLHASYARGLHAVLAGHDPSAPIELSVQLDLAGTQSFGVVPAAASTLVKMRSDWPHPSFGGRFLPIQRTVTDNGFSAEWRVSELGSSAAADVLAQRALPGIGGTGNEHVDTLEFAMVDPVNPYVMSDRAIKYGLMFIVLTFVCVGLIELMSGRRVHPVQYLLVGAALTVFFLLLLSLSEHLAFGQSYAAAAAAAVLLLGYYATAMLGGWLRGVGFGAGIAALYGALFVLLSMEQTALVIGALMMFAVLAAVMALTRRIDWYELGAKPALAGARVGS